MQFLIGRTFLVSGFTFLFTGLSIGSTYGVPGQELFETNCAACHGEDGTPVLPGTPYFSKGERLNKTDDELMKSIVEGLNVMPPWKGIMDKKEMKDCLEYVRLLAG